MAQTITSATQKHGGSGDDVSHLGDSWIELEAGAAAVAAGNNNPDRVTPLPFSNGGGEEYLRLLREAQRESKESSRVVSLAGSRRDSPRSSPKSPPNSPNNELATDNDLKGIFINYYNVDVNQGKGAWDWNSRPEECPPKVWKLPQSPPSSYSIRLAKVGKNSIFSKEVFYSLIITNMLSLIVGTGIGLWLTRRGFFVVRAIIE